MDGTYTSNTHTHTLSGADMVLVDSALACRLSLECAAWDSAWQLQADKMLQHHVCRTSDLTSLSCHPEAHALSGTTMHHVYHILQC